MHLEQPLEREAASESSVLHTLVTPTAALTLSIP
jgi:hypothetical protein